MVFLTFFIKKQWFVITLSDLNILTGFHLLSFLKNFSCIPFSSSHISNDLNNEQTFYLYCSVFPSALYIGWTKFRRCEFTPSWILFKHFAVNYFPCTKALRAKPTLLLNINLQLKFCAYQQCIQTCYQIIYLSLISSVFSCITVAIL